MRSTTLFSIYALVVIALLSGLAGMTLYSLEKARWWDARTQLAQESYGLHQRFEANLYRLFKQQGDALLIGERDAGDARVMLQQKIAQNLADIRAVIHREIDMVGDEETEELALLDGIERDVSTVNQAIAALTASGDPVDNLIQVERLAALLDGEIDRELDRKIAAALDEEREEMSEVLADAAAFRARNAKMVYVILALTGVLLALGFMSFNSQIRRPVIRLQDAIERLRNANYTAPIALGGSREFHDLGGVLTQMGDGLAAREASREEQKRELEDTVAARTGELKRMVERLETGEENRKRLMADISHELRTPLAIILGEADVTLRTNPDLSNEVSDAFARIRDSARHTGQIVNDMLTVARQEAGQLRLDRQAVDLRKVIGDAAAIFPETVEVSLPEAPVIATVDEVRLRQAIIALLQNARRYGGPTISALLWERGNDVSIAVEDDGPGLTAVEKAQAFTRFFRGSNSSGQGNEGSGLGLPVVKSIVTAHDGEVTLADAENGGLRVTLTVPRHPKHGAPYADKDIER